MSLIMKMLFNPSAAIVARSMSRAVIGSLHFSISNLIQQSIRAERFGAPLPEAGGIDAANEALAAHAEGEETARVRAEQGFEVNGDPLETAARLKTIRDYLANDLLANAALRASLTQPGVSFPDPYHLGGTFEDSLKFQIGLKPRISEAQIKAEAKALNVEESAVRDAIVANHTRQVAFLEENRDDIVRIYNGLVTTDDGDPEVAFEKLHPMLRLRLAAKADSGLYQARMREIQAHLRGGPRAVEAKGNVALCDGTRRDVLAEVQRWMKDAAFKGAVDSAVERGQTMPTFSPEPHVQKPDEVVEAMAKHQRTGTTG